MRQAAEKYIVRLPDGMRERIRRNAVNNHRSMNAEIIHHLDLGLEVEETKGAAGTAIPPRHDHTQTDEGIGNE